MSYTGYLLFLQKNFSVVMVDEAHERTLSTDILFGLVKVSRDYFNLLNHLLRKYKGFIWCTFVIV